MVSAPEKDPAKVRAGSIGARNRWAGHPRRVVRLDSLDPTVANVIRALVAADAEARKSVPPEAA